MPKRTYLSFSLDRASFCDFRFSYSDLDTVSLGEATIGNKILDTTKGDVD